MNWQKVIISLQSAASDMQSRANEAGAVKDRHKTVTYDAAADMLRAMARALEHGLPRS